MRGNKWRSHDELTNTTRACHSNPHPPLRSRRGVDGALLYINPDTGSPEIPVSPPALAGSVDPFFLAPQGGEVLDPFVRYVLLSFAVGSCFSCWEFFEWLSDFALEFGFWVAFESGSQIYDSFWWIDAFLVETEGS